MRRWLKRQRVAGLAARAQRRFERARMRSATRRGAMPIALLHRISRERLPFAGTREEDVEFVRILVLAGLLKAAIPPAITTPVGAIDQPAAVVFAITPLGQQMLLCFPLAEGDAA
jgi:hypothetical protein